MPARRPVPWRRGGLHPPAADRGEPARRGHRPARQPLLRHRHPRRHPGLQQGQDEPTRHALFIDASSDFAQGTNQNQLRPDDIDKIVAAYTRLKTVEKYAYRATLDEIRENDYNLNIPRYVDTFEEQATIDLPAVQLEIDELEAQLATVRKEMRGHLKNLGIQ